MNRKMERDNWNKRVKQNLPEIFAVTQELFNAKTTGSKIELDYEGEEELLYETLQDVCIGKMGTMKGGMVLFALAVLELQADSFGISS